MSSTLDRPRKSKCGRILRDWRLEVGCNTEGQILRPMILRMDPSQTERSLGTPTRWFNVEERVGPDVDRGGQMQEIRVNGSIDVVVRDKGKSFVKESVVKAVAKIKPTPAIRELRKDEIGRLTAPQQCQGWVPIPPRGRSPAQSEMPEAVQLVALAVHIDACNRPETRRRRAWQVALPHRLYQLYQCSYMIGPMARTFAAPAAAPLFTVPLMRFVGYKLGVVTNWVHWAEQ
ncbi:hypothetical protein B0H19DRAFT_1084888 [Mycena capillaripes]|nr:hypothetical protein B0H19DRAFT_1084888 [Mycena capillaripes]